MRFRLALVLIVSLWSNTGGLQCFARPQNATTPSQEQASGGIINYPRIVSMAEANGRLSQIKAPSWLSVETYHTNDSIKDVIRHFKKQSEHLNRDKHSNPIVSSLMRDNWKLRKGTLAFLPTVFIVGAELKAAKPAEEIETTLGVIALEDALVRIHLMSPHPASVDNNQLSAGTMILIIRERLPQEPSSDVAAVEKAYTGREVTRRARIKSKPTPDHPGGYGYTVVLKAILHSTGKVTNIRIVEGRSEDAVTQAAIKAARKIVFEPAIKDGRYVSQWVQLEYNFYP